MSGWFITTLIFAALTVAAFLAVRFVRDERGGRIVGYVVPAIPAGITALLLLISSLIVVPTNTVAIVTSFGRPVDVETNGLHFTAPWAKTARFEAIVQPLKFAGDGKAEDAEQCVSVRLANQATACVNATIQWKMPPEKAVDLYRAYRDFERVRQFLVQQTAQQSVGAVFSNHNPLAALGDPNAKLGTLEEFSVKATEELHRRIGDKVQIVGVVVSFIDYDDQTDKKLSDMQAELANTQIAQQRSKTAEAEADANRKLAASLTNDPSVMTSKCLDLVERIYKAGGSLPPGFSCFPTNGTGLVFGAK